MEDVRTLKRNLGGYTSLFNFIAQKRLAARDTDVREIHSVLISTITTIPLMWVHVFLMANFMEGSLPYILGIIFSIIHMFTPLLFRVTKSSFVVMNCMLVMAVGFVIVKAIYTGGIESLEMIWLMAPPMLSGVASGRRGASLWAMISAGIMATFLTIAFLGHQFTNHLSPQGNLLLKYFLMIGGLTLGSVLSFVSVILREETEKRLTEQTTKVDSLFRVLFHDLANSLGRINIGLTIAKKNPQAAGFTRGLEIASEASETMFEITQNVRRMYAVSKGKADMDLILHPVSESIEYVEKLYAQDLEKKKISIEWDKEKLKGLSVFVEPVSFKNQVLGNIISNAIKFSSQDSTIKISAYPTNHHYYTIEIKDTGIGMPALILNNLFDMNKKTSRPGTAGEFGTGFGMHIMKSFVEIYQGQVVVESIESQGTTFKLTLKGEWT